MNEIAIIASRIRTSVFQNVRINFTGLKPSSNPDTIAARKQPVPVAESQLKSYRAASGVGFATTGTAREIALCRYGTSHPGGPARTLPLAITTRNAGVVARFMASFMDGRPHRSTKRDKMAKGIHAFRTCPAV